MKREITFRYQGKTAMLEGQELLRMFPNRYMDMVGPFAFLDYFAPRYLPPRTPVQPDGGFAHPHRGIATLTYLLEGQMEHYDSLGNQNIVSAGGVQWMKAGKGIIHDEQPPMAFQESGGNMHGMQFWINLPALEKARDPEYLPLEDDEIPRIQLPENAGEIKLVLGEFHGAYSPIPSFSGQQMLHVKLNAGGRFHLHSHDSWEYAALHVSGEVQLNDEFQDQTQLLVFGSKGKEIVVENQGEGLAEIILFGGEAYLEPVVAQGPFIMNTKKEIYQAYVDYGQGAYGKIKYNKQEIIS